MTLQDLIDLDGEPVYEDNLNTKELTNEELISRVQGLEAELRHVQQALLTSQHALSYEHEKNKYFARSVGLPETEGLPKPESLIKTDRIGGNDYIVVILDGNAAQFNPDFVREARVGGWTAAHKLKKAVKLHFQADKDCEIIVKIYLNQSALLNSYCDWSNVTGFTHGFTSFKAQFEFIDVGPSVYGDATLNFTLLNIKEAIKFFLKDSGCSKLILGVPFHEEYSSMLEPYVGDQRITLINAITMQEDQTDTLSSFESMSMLDIFRDMRPKPRIWRGSRLVVEDTLLVDGNTTTVIESKVIK